LGGEHLKKGSKRTLWCRSGADTAVDDRGIHRAPIVISRIPPYCVLCWWAKSSVPRSPSSHCWRTWCSRWACCTFRRGPRRHPGGASRARCIGAQEHAASAPARASLAFATLYHALLRLCRCLTRSPRATPLGPLGAARDDSPGAVCPLSPLCPAPETAAPTCRQSDG
jgi:hypothetical protein